MRPKKKLQIRVLFDLCDHIQCMQRVVSFQNARGSSDMVQVMSGGEIVYS